MDESLRELAEAAGLPPHYEDARGALQRIEPTTLAAVLERLGLPAGDERARQVSLARLREADAGPLPPLVTADAGEPALLPGRRRGRVRIALEGGGIVEGGIARRRGRDAAPVVSEPGYHELVVGDERTTLAVAPPRCFWPEGEGAERHWGVAAQIYALRRPGDGGIGDFTAVAELAEAAAAHGAHALAVSPVHAMFAADPGRASPYSPSNRLHLNGLLADPAEVFGPERVAAAAEALGLGEDRARWEAAALIDWEAAGTAKLALLRRLFDDASGEGALAAFEAERPHLPADVETHAVFELLHARLRGEDGRPLHWRDWGPDHADPSAAGVAAARGEHGQDAAFHVFLQWLARRGLKAAQGRARAAGMPIGLIADLAVGADGGGSQAWGSRADMLTGLHIGAPPDIHNPKGQDWGLAALDPFRLRRAGFDAFLRMIRASLAWAGGIRIDHILGLHRVWVIPEGRPPAEGAYLHFPMTDLLRLVTLESVRHGAAVVGEDLGTVPGGLRRVLAARGILGMSVLWFEQARGGFLPPVRWRAESAAMTTTHDLPTVAGWWSERDLDWRDRLDLFPSPGAAAEARASRARERKALWRAMRRAGAVEGPAPRPEAPPVDAALAHVARTPCRLALAPVEDLLGLVEQPNLPGTVAEHPNWRRRLPEAARRCEGAGMPARLAAFREGRREG